MQKSGESLGAAARVPSPNAEDNNNDDASSVSSHHEGDQEGGFVTKLNKHDVLMGYVSKKALHSSQATRKAAFADFFASFSFSKHFDRRGAPSAEYEGNARLRGIVLDRRGDYVDARKRKDKHRIAVEIIETVYANSGRFLRRIEDEKQLKAKGLEPTQAAWEVVKDRTELLSKVRTILECLMSPPVDSLRLTLILFQNSVGKATAA